MSETKHTPGPWATTTRKGSWDWVVFVPNTPYEICQMFHDGTEWNETGEANARLIAAAPELLEALKVAANALYVIHSDHHEAQSADYHARQALAVIAKAEGVA